MRMKRKINLSEAYIGSVVRSVINEMFDEAKIAYDPHMLDGIDSIDARSINYFIQAMIPEGNRVSVNSPYKAIRQLVLYFSPEGAIKHGGKLVKDIVNFMLKNETLSSKIFEITKKDKEINSYIYGDKKLTGKPLMQQIVWCLDDMISQLGQLNAVMNSENFKNYFGDSEAMIGSKDGKRVGLSTILFHAYMGCDEIKKQIKKMQSILDKGNDALSYTWRI